MDLRNKTVVLTGANGGLGQEIAQVVAAAGARLILVGIGPEALEKQAAELSANGENHAALSLDLCSHEGIEELVQFCMDLPSGIDVLINGAGLNHFALLEDCELEKMSRLLTVNLIAPVMLTASLLPLLQQKKEGLIVNIGSILGAIGNPGYAAYCASKSGIIRFSEALRRELTDTQVHVLQLNPRVIETPMNSSTVNFLNKKLGNKADKPRLVANLLLNRIQSDQFGECNVGWPEKLFVKINSLLPRLVDGNFRKNLALIKRAARNEISSSSNGARQDSVHYDPLTTRR